MRLTYEVETFLAQGLSLTIVDEHFDTFGTQLGIGRLIAIKASERYITNIAVYCIRFYNHIILFLRRWVLISNYNSDFSILLSPSPSYCGGDKSGG